MQETISPSCVWKKVSEGNRLAIYEGRRENRKFLKPKLLYSLPVKVNVLWLRVAVNDQALCEYSYSTDGINFSSVGEQYKAEKGMWIGAKVGLVALHPGLLKSKGYADFDFFDVR